MLDSTSQVSGSVWHMVDEFWLKRWRKFVLGRAARRYEPPGPITNEHLLESVARTRYLMEEGMTVEERKKRQKELDERATTVPPPIRREARLEFDQRSAAVEKYQTPLDEDSKEEPADPEPATIGKHYRAINYDLWTYWRMVHGSEAIKLQAPFNFGCVVVCVRCFYLNTVACISRRSCPSLGRKHGRGAAIARRE